MLVWLTYQGAFYNDFYFCSMGYILSHTNHLFRKLQKAHTPPFSKFSTHSIDVISVSLHGHIIYKSKLFVICDTATAETFIGQGPLNSRTLLFFLLDLPLLLLSLQVLYSTFTVALHCGKRFLRVEADAWLFLQSSDDLFAAEI